MTVTSYGQAARTVTRVFRTASKSITRSSNALSNYSELWSKTALASTELTKVNFNLGKAIALYETSEVDTDKITGRVNLRFRELRGILLLAPYRNGQHRQRRHEDNDLRLDKVWLYLSSGRNPLNEHKGLS